MASGQEVCHTASGINCTHIFTSDGFEVNVYGETEFRICKELPISSTHFYEEKASCQDTKESEQTRRNLGRIGKPT